MFRTPKVGTRALAGVATIATLTGVSLPLMATAASAAVSSVTANPSSYQAAAGSTVNVTANVQRTAGDTTPVRFAIVSGPDADAATNGNLVADGDCGPLGGTTVTCSVQNTKGAGTDVVRIFADNNSNQVLDPGEPSSDATIVFYGAPAAVSINPASDSAAAGTCNVFTVTVTDAGGRATPGTTVRLETTLTGTTTGRTLTYCQPNPDNNTPATQAVGTPTAANGTTPATGTVTTDANGKAAFGIRSDQPGTATVRAYVDTAGAGHTTGTFDAGEPSATATKTFTAGGAAGNAAQDAVTSLTVTPTTQSSIVGDLVTYTITAKNAAGDPTPNVTISGVIAGPNASAPQAFTTQPTNNDGQAVFKYIPGAAGTDTLTFWVNQTAGATAGADSNEPKATATDTVAAAPTGYTIDLTCAGNFAGGSASAAPGGETAAQRETREETCVNPTTDNNETFTAFVSKGTDTAGNPIPAAGILVRFDTSNTTAPGQPTLSATSGTTDAKGLVTVTLTDTKEANGSVDSVTARIAGQTTPQAGGQNSDTATKTWQTAHPATVTVSPALNTTQTGQQSTFVATVTDQFNRPVAGVNTDFFISGRNSTLNGPALLDKVTDANGQATLSYTDVGPANNVSGGNASDTITARADYVAENDAADAGEPTGSAQNNFITEPATAGTVDLDVTGTGACGSTLDPADDATSFAPSTSTHPVCALVKTAGGALLTGKTVTFTLSGVGSFAASSSDATAKASPQTATTDANGVATVYVTSTKSGAQNITATIDGKSDTGTITYTAATVAEARNIDLKPDTSTLNNGNNELTALVTDRFGNPVSGVTVNFTETGPAQFSNGTSSSSAVTGSTGTVTVTLTSAAGTTGTDTVTATIGTAGTQCGSAAGTPAGTTAGNCSDSATYTLQNKPTGKTPTISISRTVINIGKGGSGVGVTGTPGHTVWLYAYSRPSTTYVAVRKGTFNSLGQITFTVSPRTNTRLFARDMTSGLSSSSGTISVHPALSLVGSAHGKVGSFSGTYVPGQGGAAIRLFTVKNGVLSASPVGTATTDASGHWTFSRTFAAHGPVTFIVQSLANLTNASGQGNRVTITFS